MAGTGSGAGAAAFFSGLAGAGAAFATLLRGAAAFALGVGDLAGFAVAFGLETLEGFAEVGFLEVFNKPVVLREEPLTLVPTPL